MNHGMTSKRTSQQPPHQPVSHLSDVPLSQCRVCVILPRPATDGAPRCTCHAGSATGCVSRMHHTLGQSPAGSLSTACSSPIGSHSQKQRPTDTSRADRQRPQKARRKDQGSLDTICPSFRCLSALVAFLVGRPPLQSLPVITRSTHGGREGGRCRQRKRCLP